MTANISFRIENDILLCFVTGERGCGSVLEYWQKLINKCHQEDIQLVQITLALRGKFNPFDAIESYQSIIEMVKPTSLKIATVDLNHLSASDTQVSCKMGASQGLDVAYFDSEDAAKEWLIEGVTSDGSEDIEKLA